jgi:hypothetical protein
LYAQAKLSKALADADSTFVEQWCQVRSEFGALVPQDGARWAELPWEAIFTAGWSARGLEALRATLTSDADVRAEAIRTVMLRFNETGACEPATTAPLVAFLASTPGLVGSGKRSRDEAAIELVLAWLR